MFFFFFFENEGALEMLAEVLCAHCWLSFQEKVGQKLGELALEQPNGLEHVHFPHI